MAEAPLDFVSAHVVEAQEALGRQILIENPSSYLRFPHSAAARASPHSPADRATAARVTGLTDQCLSYLDYDWSLDDAARAER